MLSFADLPSTKPGQSFSLEAATEVEAAYMADTFVQIMKDSGWLPDMPCFKHMLPIQGLPGSCRLLLDRPYQQSVPLPAEGMTQREMANHLLCMFSLEARFRHNQLMKLTIVSASRFGKLFSTAMSQCSCLQVSIEFNNNAAPPGAALLI